MKSIELFDSAQILENFDFAALKDVYGWSGIWKQVNVVDEDEKENLLFQLKQIQAGQNYSDWHKFLTNNEHDFELYECAKQIASGATSCNCTEFE